MSCCEEIRALRVAAVGDAATIAALRGQVSDMAERIVELSADNLRLRLRRPEDGATIVVESPSEAQARAIGPLLAAIRDEARDAREASVTTVDPAGLLTADELETGMQVKVAGEWYPFVRLDGAGRLVLAGDVPGVEFFYGPTDGERFLWTGCF